MIMNKSEFEERMDMLGIDLSILGIVIGKRVGIASAIGVYQKNDAWVTYFVDDDNHCTEVTLNESETFSRLQDVVFYLLKEKGYINQHITVDIVCTRKDDACRFLKLKSGLNDDDALFVWNCLKHDFRILNELKYCMRNGRFVPESESYHVNGFTAHSICRDTGLGVLDSFKCLLYLKLRPTEAVRIVNQTISKRRKCHATKQIFG